MRDPKRKHLRWKGNQWQFYKRFTKDVAALLGRGFFIQNLGTADLVQAQKLRLRKLVEFDEVCDAARATAKDIDEGIAQQLRDMPDYVDNEDETSDRNTLLLYLHDLAEKRADGRQWYRKVSGQSVPITQNVDRFVQETSAVETTQKARRAAIKRFELWMQQRKLDPEVRSVTKKIAGDFSSYLHSQGLARKTVNGLIQYLSSYWKWMVKKDLVSKNPWAGQQVAGADDENARAIWEPEEIVRLFEESPSLLLTQAMAVAALSGLRAGELASLTVADCKNGIFRVRKGKTKAAVRDVPIHTQLTETVAMRTIGKRSDQLLFPEFLGTSKGFVKRFCEHRAKLFGESNTRQAAKTLHSFRHTFITLRLRAGCPEPIVGALAGHKPKGVTLSVYHHGFAPEQLRAVVDAVRLPSKAGHLLHHSHVTAEDDLGE